ncbi:MAG: hypothetical protein M4579_004407 [Chaenotheca gracillima]|nr:MAG: hypothetical protein M4579_004407 [Chaenotheca gracillima]
MKILTTNFLTCAVKACKTSPAAFPLHFKDAELERQEVDFNPLFLKNVLPRLEWDALKIVAQELGFTSLPATKPFERPLSPPPTEFPVAGGDDTDKMDVSETEPPQPSPQPNTPEENDKILRDLHSLLIETEVMEGKLVCGNCGHEYAIKEGIANFLLPEHLVSGLMSLRRYFTCVEQLSSAFDQLYRW